MYRWGGQAAPAADAKPTLRNYPVRPVRFIIPFPPGGGTDVVGRALGQKLSENFGETFIIDNRPGAAGTLGSHIAARDHSLRQNSALNGCGHPRGRGWRSLGGCLLR